ncbi:DUF4342 domain-containing protein [Rubrivirga sp. IMCC43871]|uniref:DUF4342 domain-containing protein n=1 Tax=Rubrivirga sp. IMCC43871 TaxID=3391575 RepID=UPI00399018D0
MPDPTPKPEPTLQSEAQRLAGAARARASDAAEELKVASNQAVDKLRELIEDGNVKRVAIKHKDRVVFEMPLTVGVGAGAAAILMNPGIAAVSALAALVSDITLVIERTEDAPPASTPPDADANGDDAGADKTVGK